MTASIAIPLVLACCITIVEPVDAGPKSPLSSSHVRPLNRLLASALRDGKARSTTLRALVDALDASDVIVYLHEGTCTGRAVACTMFGDTTEGSRVLHVNFKIVGTGRDMFLSFHDRLIAQIGHELQHALEIANEKQVVDLMTLSTLYARIGRREEWLWEKRYETEAAIRAGELVLREIHQR